MKNNSQIVLALITTFGLFFCIFFILKWSFPSEIKEQLSTFTQLLGTIWTLQMNYFFGSTSGSKQKDDVIGAIAQTPIAPIAPVAPVAPVLPIAPISGKDDLPNVKNLDVKSVKIEANEVTVTPKEGT